MSVEAMALVLHHSSATGTAKLVLLGIANHEGDGGSWPSVATLSRYANADERTVQRAITSLVEAGELSRKVQEGGDRRTRGDRRTNLYRILVECPPECDHTSRHRPVDNTGSRGGVSVTPSTPRGDSAVAHGVTPVPPEPSLNHPLPTDLKERQVLNRASGHRHQFDSMSGYCGCGYRDDGRLVDPKSGTQFQAPITERASA